MIQNIKRTGQFIKHLTTSQSDRWLHSPFLYELYSEVLFSGKEYYAFDKLEKKRQQLLKDTREIQVTDFGAGSRVFKGNCRKVKDIALTAVKPSKQCRQLFQLINYFQPRHVIELGTSLGITTAYLAAAASKATIHTFEGCQEHLKIAESLWKSLELPNIQHYLGNIDNTLPKFIENAPPIDILFIDANHRLEPTLRYFHSGLQKKHDQSVFIFDDIHWSDEMFEVWKTIKSHSAVTVSIDLFHLGIVFFDPALSKQHFTLR